jgi:hypothetical protein
MPSFEFERVGDGVKRQIEKAEQTAVENPCQSYRILNIQLETGSVKNDGTDSETVTVEVVNGLDVARGDDLTVLDYDGEVTLSVDGQQITKTLTNGSVSFDVTTDKPAASEIEIAAESLADHPTESDSATIEVVSQ